MFEWKEEEEDDDFATGGGGRVGDGGHGSNVLGVDEAAVEMRVQRFLAEKAAAMQQQAQLGSLSQGLANVCWEVCDRERASKQPDCYRNCTLSIMRVQRMFTKRTIEFMSSQAKQQDFSV